MFTLLLNASFDARLCPSYRFLTYSCFPSYYYFFVSSFDLVVSFAFQTLFGASVVLVVYFVGFSLCFMSFIFGASSVYCFHENELTLCIVFRFSLLGN